MAVARARASGLCCRISGLGCVGHGSIKVVRLRQGVRLRGGLDALSVRHFFWARTCSFHLSLRCSSDLSASLYRTWLHQAPGLERWRCCICLRACCACCAVLPLDAPIIGLPFSAIASTKPFKNRPLRLRGRGRLRGLGTPCL